tara:strand:- start:1605 stop:1844 length:240 start_codon:yes stop_codon:yes gene_type:complete
MNKTNDILYKILQELEIKLNIEGEKYFLPFNELGLDSLDLIKFIMKVEEHFDVEIPDNEVEKISSIDDLRIFIEKTSTK